MTAQLAAEAAAQPAEKWRARKTGEMQAAKNGELVEKYPARWATKIRRCEARSKTLPAEAVTMGKQIK